MLVSARSVTPLREPHPLISPILRRVIGVVVFAAVLIGERWLGGALAPVGVRHAGGHHCAPERWQRRWRPAKNVY